MSSDIEVQTNTQKMGKAPRSALRKKGAKRAPGRPHKRLETEVLSTRTIALRKKLQVLVAKKTLIADRLEAYEAESDLRQKEEQEEQTAKN
jgi:hypothetical protein